MKVLQVAHTKTQTRIVECLTGTLTAANQQAATSNVQPATCNTGNSNCSSNIMVADKEKNDKIYEL